MPGKSWPIPDDVYAEALFDHARRRGIEKVQSETDAALLARVEAAVVAEDRARWRRPELAAVWRPCLACRASVEVPAIVDGCDLLVPICGPCKRAATSDPAPRNAPSGPPKQPDDLTIAAINRSLKVMAEHGGGMPDYIGGLPVAEPPYPFVCTSVDDVAEAFRRSTGVPVAFVTDVPALRVALGSVTEMEATMRRTAELVHWLAPFAFAYTAEHPESNMPTKVDVDDTC